MTSEVFNADEKKHGNRRSNHKHCSGRNHVGWTNLQVDLILGPPFSVEVMIWKWFSVNPHYVSRTDLYIYTYNNHVYICIHYLEPIWPLFWGVDLPLNFMGHIILSSKIWVIWVLGKIQYIHRSSTLTHHNHGSVKWVHRILVSFHLGKCSTCMIMRERVYIYHDLPLPRSFHGCFSGN